MPNSEVEIEEWIRLPSAGVKQEKKFSGTSRALTGDADEKRTI